MAIVHFDDTGRAAERHSAATIQTAANIQQGRYDTDTDGSQHSTGLPRSCGLLLGAFTTPVPPPQQKERRLAGRVRVHERVQDYSNYGQMSIDEHRRAPTGIDEHRQAPTSIDELRQVPTGIDSH